MTKTLKLTIACLVLALPAFAQTLLINTTLASAVAGARGTGINLTSVSNVKAGYDIIVDQEIMCVNTVPSTGTIIFVTRGCAGSRAKSHLNSSFVFIVPDVALAYAIVDVDPQGACARGSATITNGVGQTASTQYLPIFDVRNGAWSDCLGGVFQTGDGWPSQVSQFGIQGAATGGTIYTSLNTAGTTLSATTQYCTEIDLPANKVLTGLGILNGTTVGTDKHLVALYDAAGALLANSAVAGVTSATASNYQKIAFTSQYLAIGPAQYFACMQTNGTTDTVRMLVTQVNDTYLTKGVTGQTFGTLAALTVPTTFTTAVGPYYLIY